MQSYAYSPTIFKSPSVIYEKLLFCFSIKYFITISNSYINDNNSYGSHELIFQNLTTVVILFLKDVLGPTDFDKRAEEAWQKSLEVANSVIINALEGKEQS